MTASQLIAQLKTLQRKHGDLPVVLVNGEPATVEYDTYDDGQDPAFVIDYLTRCRMTTQSWLMGGR